MTNARPGAEPLDPDALPAPDAVATALGPVELLADGSGPAVLAVHGAMGGCDQSMLLARTIGVPGYRHVAVSRPGYLGTPLGSRCSSERQGDLHAATLDALGIDRAAVMAVSGGGPSALQFALRHPDRCWGLVLVSTCSGRVTERIPLAFHVTRLLLRSSWLAERMRRKADVRKAAARSIRDPSLRARTLEDPGAGPLFRALVSSTLDRAHLRIAGTENDIAVTRAAEYALERIACPTLIVHGTADAVVSFDHARAAAEHTPRAELLAIEGGEHVAIFTHRDAVRARVGAFFRQHAPAARERANGR